MLKEKNSFEITTKCIDCLPLVYIACPSENHGFGVIMAPITEEQEKQLSEDDYIIVKDQFNRQFVVNDKSCYAYGELDLSPNSDDIRKIINSRWFDSVYVNMIVFTRYDYNTHTVTSDVAGGRWYETNNVENYLPFLYAKIGKPDRVVIFRCDTDIFSSRKKHKTKTKETNHKHYLATKDYYTDYHKNKTIAKRKAKVSSLQFKIKKQL